jgi:hypothetical protein
LISLGDNPPSPEKPDAESSTTNKTITIFCKVFIFSPVKKKLVYYCIISPQTVMSNYLKNSSARTFCQRGCGLRCKKLLTGIKNLNLRPKVVDYRLFGGFILIELCIVADLSVEWKI